MAEGREGISKLLVLQPDGSLSINIEVQPAASKVGITGFNEWRSRLQVSVSEPAHKGAANRALKNLLSDVFGIPKKLVIIERGAKSRPKRVKIFGISHADALQILESEIGE